MLIIIAPFYVYTWCNCNTLLKSKRHSLRCHDFLVHAYLLRMCTNVVDFRVMRRLCRREWNWQRNWQSLNQHSWDPWQWTTWSRPVTSYFNSVYAAAVKAQTSIAPLSRFRGSRVTTAHAHQCCVFQSYAKTVRMKLTSFMGWNWLYYDD